MTAITLPMVLSAAWGILVAGLGAWLTDLTGGRRKPLTGGPRYHFPVNPQQIVTLRFGAGSAVSVPEPIRQWDELVPSGKLPALHEYSDQKGHPRDAA